MPGHLMSSCRDAPSHCENPHKASPSPATGRHWSTSDLWRKSTTGAFLHTLHLLQQSPNQTRSRNYKLHPAECDDRSTHVISTAHGDGNTVKTCSRPLDDAPVGCTRTSEECGQCWGGRGGTSQLGAHGLAMDAVTVAGELLMWRPSMVAEMVYTPGCIATYWKHAAPCFMPAALTVVRLGPSTDTCTT